MGEAIKTARFRPEVRATTREALTGTIHVTDGRQRSVAVSDEAGTEVAVLRTITKDSPYAGAVA